mgnify:CR=1 FL=1
MSSGVPPYIVWKSEYSVREPTLDAQHQEIFQIINTLYGQIRSGVTDEEFYELVEKAKGFADRHFRTEERVMYDCGFPELDNHERAHRRYVEKVVALTPTKPRDSDERAYDLLSFLKQWWKNHVKRMDQKYVSYLQHLHHPVKAVGGDD